MSKQQVRTRPSSWGQGNAFLIRHPHFAEGVRAGADVYRARYAGAQLIKDTDVLQFFHDAEPLASLYFPAYAGLIFGWMQAYCAKDGRRLRFCTTDFLAGFTYAGNDHEQGFFSDLDSDIALIYFLSAFLRDKNPRGQEIDTFDGKAGYICGVHIGLLLARRVIDRTEPPELFGLTKIRQFHTKVSQLFALADVEVAR